MRNDLDDDDWEDPSYEDDYGDDSDDEPTRRCSNCGYEMLEICVQCPSCGEYPSNESIFESSHARWVVLAAFLCLAVIFFWMVLL